MSLFAVVKCPHNYRLRWYFVSVYYTRAVSAVVPMLPTVLSRMIPMLGATKQDNMQWVFAYGKTTLATNRNTHLIARSI